MYEVEKPVPNSGYCYDCTVEHAAVMRANSKCEYPLTTFITRGNAELICGRRPRRAPPR